MYIAVRVLCTSSYRSVWLTVGSIVYTKRKFPGKRRHSKARKFSPFSKSSHLPAFIVLFWVSKFQFVLVIYDIKSHFSFTDEALVHKYCNMTDVVLRVRCDKGRNWLKFIQGKSGGIDRQLLGFVFLLQIYYEEYYKVSTNIVGF